MNFDQSFTEITIRDHHQNLSEECVARGIESFDIYGDGQDAKKHPRNSDKVVGSGPFKLVEFVRDQHIILERYDGYFIKDRPYVDKLVIRIIKDPAARALGRKNGEILLLGKDLKF